MTNEKVIQAFLNKEKAQTNLRDVSFGVYTYKGRTLISYGDKLLNYSTTIAFWQDNTLYLNVKKYSQTTSKIQNKIRSLASDKNISIVEYK